MDFDQFVSTTVKHQFPSFYEVEGETFIAFVKAYYEFLEQEGYAINASRNLLNYMDIDATIDLFIQRFKNEFMSNFPAITSTNSKFLIKNIKDFYTAKGSIQGLELLFRLLFADDINVFLPSSSVLKPSDGIWQVPRYLETEHNDRNRTFIGQEIIGSVSGAKAIVESVYSKIIQNRILDVVKIVEIQGEFVYGEVISDNGIFLNAPKITGSLTTIDVIEGGAGNKVGDLFTITSSTSGKYGSATVVSVVDGSGRVNFVLVDGGSGYTNSSSQVYISTTTAEYTGSGDTFLPFEIATQPLASANILVTSPPSINVSALNGQNVYGWVTSNGFQAASGTVVANPSTNTIVISQTAGNFALADKIGTSANAILITGYNYANVTATGSVTGSNSGFVGFHSTTNIFYANAPLTTSTSNTHATLTRIHTGNGATFGIQGITDVQNEVLFTDFISGNNASVIPYLNILVGGGNSNAALLIGTSTITCNTNSNIVNASSNAAFVSSLTIGSGLYLSPGNTYIGSVNSIANNTQLTLTANALANGVTSVYYYNLGSYGFPKYPAGGLNAILSDALTFSTFSLGTISGISGINPGTNYSAAPFVSVYNAPVAALNRRNLVLTLTNIDGPIFVGDAINQTVNPAVATIAYNANVGAFTVGEGMTQSNGTSNSYGTLLGANSTYLTLGAVRGTFLANSAGGQNIFGINSHSTANVTAVGSSTIIQIAAGVVENVVNSSVIEIKRAGLNEDFQSGSNILTNRGTSATVITIGQGANSSQMGFNANISDLVFTANGIATELAVVDSGFGHQPGDTLVLSNDTNPFVIEGTAKVINQGMGVGNWKDTRGFLDSDMFIHDNDYYQEFSYEIQSKISLDKYADIMKQIAHMIGTKMFGKVLINSHQNVGVSVSSVSIVESVPSSNNNNETVLITVIL